MILFWLLWIALLFILANLWINLFVQSAARSSLSSLPLRLPLNRPSLDLRSFDLDLDLDEDFLLSDLDRRLLFFFFFSFFELDQALSWPTFSATILF